VINLSKGCSKCKNGRSCNNYHLYAIELKKKAIKEPGFPFEGELERGKKVYYVGWTKHTIECRYKQHVRRRSKSSKRFNCGCFNEHKLRDLGKPGKYTNHHKKGGLRPKLTHHRNPAVEVPEKGPKGYLQTYKEMADIAEEKFAEELRSEGHAVHFN
tara:strand:+ start:255 stop:725 length:471 start_codon:yes stop_codon:yes gene_type:complete